MLRFPPEFPPSFAFACGDDEFGIWTDLSISSICQRFRWIEPGEFLMGSPTIEIGHQNREHPQHRVRITQGFWLADTACTQEFWLAVVGGKNPAHFKDNLQNPVEQVSWDDVNKRFLVSLNGVLPDKLEAVLPNEAQWEYACRAGTLLPFNFGVIIVPEKVNFDGNFPYAGALKGQNRECTVPVKSMSPNDWGLYEMHGNVWEWCRDGLRKYVDETVRNPEGQADGARALRGGSWFHDAASARAAHRIARSPAYCQNNFGFRLLIRPRGSGSNTTKT